MNSDAPFISRQNRDVQSFEGVFMETVPKGYFRAYENKVLVLDKANEDIILVAKFNSFSSMSEDLRNEFGELTKHFIHLKDGASEVKINSAKTHGKMYALGWRCGEFVFILFHKILFYMFIIYLYEFVYYLMYVLFYRNG